MNKISNPTNYFDLIFRAFIIAFAILFVISFFKPISNYKMIILSVVAFLLSLQQMLEAKEEALHDIRFFRNREKNSKYPPDSDTHDSFPAKRFKQLKFAVIGSRIVFLLAMIFMITGLVLDFNIQCTNLVNSLTIASFAAIFAAMRLKGIYLRVLKRAHAEMIMQDQVAIEELEEQIANLEKQLNENKSSEK